LKKIFSIKTAAVKIEDRMWLFRLDAHHRFFTALAISAVTFFFIKPHFTTSELTLVTWSAFALVTLVLMWATILATHPSEVRRIAKLEDSSRTLIFLFVVGAAIASLAAVVFLIKAPKNATDTEITGHVLLAIGAVIVSWCLVHTVFTIRYAHLYYDTDTDDGGTRHAGGLDFPGKEEHPDYLDFVYFSFVIGMTFQVSDVEISSRSIRRLALFHALIAFAFNTAIVALSINVVSGLIGGNK
jgi:uncharacterized membrane protein